MYCWVEYLRGDGGSDWGCDRCGLDFSRVGIVDGDSDVKYVVYCASEGGGAYARVITR